MEIRDKALFLDRDGVINVDYGYVHTRERFHFIEGVFDLVRVGNCLGYRIIVVTNQAGIARGYYTEQELSMLHSWMLSCFKSRDLTIDAIYYCPFHPSEGKGVYLHDSFDRKPKPGMIYRAIKDFNIDPERSILIGDSPSDIIAAQAANVALSILFSSTSYENCRPSYRIKYLKEAIPILIQAKRQL